MPEDVRRNLAEQFAGNLYSLVRGVLGYRDVTPSCHGPLCAWHDRNSSRIKLTLMPRGHLKTSVITIGGTIKRVVNDPNIRILLRNETGRNAERFLGMIKAHAESNKVFRALYSHIIRMDPKGGWNNSELLFKRDAQFPEPTITALGMTGAATSGHYNHQEYDDPIAEEAARSSLVMEDAIARISEFKNLMVDPGKDTMNLTGTRWAIYDVYSYMEAKLGVQMAKFIRAAIEDGKPIWPERFNPEVLAEIRGSYESDYKWSCLMMNSPRDIARQDFNVEDLRFWRWVDEAQTQLALITKSGELVKVIGIEDLDICMTVDVRYGEKKDSDRDAIVVTGTTESGDVLVLHAWAERANPLAVISELVACIRRYKPRVLGVQKVGYEMSIKWHLAAALEEAGLYVRVVPVRPGGPGKPHIRGLQTIAATGHMYILPTQLLLRQELDDYPLGKTDDVADTLALQQQLWRGVLAADRINKYRETEAKIIRRLEAGMHNPLAAKLLLPDKAGNLPHPDDIGYDPEEHRYGEVHSFIIQ